MKTQLTLVLTALSLATLAGFVGGHIAQAQGSVRNVVAPPQSTYAVEVKTGCLTGAGTDANVKVRLIQNVPGGTRSTSLITLDNPDNNDFERGNIDKFLPVAAKLDRIDAVYLAHDNTGSAPGWLVREVRVFNYATGKLAIFPVQRWLATDECNGAISLILKAGERPTCTPYYYGPGAGC